MPTAARDREAAVAVILGHRPANYAGLVSCSCGTSLSSAHDHAEHVVTALAAAATPEPPRAVKPGHLRLLLLLAEARGEGLTDTQLSRRWAVKIARPQSSWPLISDSGIRSRRAELVGWRLVEEVPGVRGRTLTNRPTRLWRLSDGSAAALPAPWPRETREAFDALLVEAGVDVVTRAALVLAQAVTR